MRGRNQGETLSAKCRLLFLLPAVIGLSLVGCSEESRSERIRPPRGWQRVFPSFAAPVHDLLRDPDDPNVIYAACSWQQLSRTERIGGVLRSADHGITWLSANRGIPPGTEVLVLVFLPADFAGNPGALLAGTRNEGIYISSDSGSSWQLFAGPETAGAERSVADPPAKPDWGRLTIQALIVLPGEPPALAVGTDGFGVQVGTGDGAKWEARNEGLLTVNVQALALDSQGAVLAGTWYGGVYRSKDRGLQWERLYPEPNERAVVSSVVVDEDGTLWIGRQNAGLFALPANDAADSLAPFAREPEGVMPGVGILAISSFGRQVVVGTNGKGVVFAKRGGADFAVEDGLDNKTVSAVLLDREQPDEILLGTWGGLYRSIPPRSMVLPVSVSAALAVLALGAGLAIWRRSVPAAAGALYRCLGNLEPNKVLEYLSSEIARLEPARGREVLKRLARRLARARDDPRANLAEMVALTAKLLGLIHKAGDRIDADLRQSLAATLDKRVEAMEALAEGSAPGIGFPGIQDSAHAAALQGRLFAALFRADSTAHVAALQPDLAELEKRGAPFLDSELYRDLHRVMDALEQLGRLPSAEDRALFLGQALTQILEAQKGLSERRARRPAHGTSVGAVVLESLRELLQTALQDIRQRAVLSVELHSRVLKARREAVVVLDVRNTGKGHARNVAVELLSDEESLRVVEQHQGVKSLLRDQSARLEFLVEPRSFDRMRLSFHITYDDLERQGQQREFADVVEFQQLKPQHAYRLLRPNPYVVGRPLTAKDLFIGRQDVFDRIAANLKGAQQDNVVALIGQRRTGKTSILRRMHLHLGDDYMPVLVDLQGFLGKDELSFFKAIAETVCDELEALGLRMESCRSYELDADPGRLFRHHFLKNVRRALGGRRLLLMFDEFEVIEELIRTGALTARILPYFRSLMQHEKSVSFMLAGTHRLDDLTASYWGVFFNLAVYFDVGYLHEDEVERLFTEPTRDFFEIDPLALDKVYRLTGGHPLFSQLMARQLVELCNRERLAYVTVQDVNTVAERAGEKGQHHFSYLWEEATRSERLLLLAVKELLEREGLATISAAHRYLTDRRLGPGDLHEAAGHLAHKEILSDNAGQLTFHIDLLRVWIDRHQDIESFMLTSPRRGEEE